MLDLYFWPTPNGYKITLFLEEAGLEYRTHYVNIGAGDQFKPDFLKISPNNKMPALVDTEPNAVGAAIAVFESGAILQYLAEKTGKFLSTDLRGRYETLQWLYWQVAGFGPMAGQNNHFNHYAPEKIPYAMERYINETARLFRVMNERLADREFLAGEYSIADMASYPWAISHERLSMKIAEYPHVKRWLDTIAKRPATIRAYEKEKPKTAPLDEKSRKILFGQK